MPKIMKQALGYLTVCDLENNYILLLWYDVCLGGDKIKT